MKWKQLCQCGEQYIDDHMVVCLEIIIKHPINLGKHAEHRTSCSKFIVMYVASIYLGERYILTLIDDLAHFTWGHFMKNKNLVFEKFKEFRAFSKKECGRPIKHLRLDNGGEYVN